MHVVDCSAAALLLLAAKNFLFVIPSRYISAAAASSTIIYYSSLPDLCLENQDLYARTTVITTHNTMEYTKNVHDGECV